MKTKFGLLLQKIALLALIPLLTTAPSIPLFANTTPVVIEEIEDAGTYPVELEVVNDRGEKMKRTINVTIERKRTIIQEELGEAIDAVDVVIPEGTFQDLSNLDLISIAKAKAWMLGDGTPIEISSVSSRVHSKELGIYIVTFSTVNGTQTESYFREQFGKEPLNGKSYLYIDDNQRRISFSQLFISALIIILPTLFFFHYLKVKREVDEINRVLYSKK